MNNHFYRLKYLLALLLILSFKIAKAQLTVDNAPPNNSVDLLVNNILINNPLVNTSNISFIGNAQQIGYFNSVNSNVGIETGIILSTGEIWEAPGPNNSSGNFNPCISSSNSLLENEFNINSNDAANLTFNFIAQSNTLNFNYVFASEEYPEYVGSYNDAFGFFLSGPNPNGGNYNNYNIALLPNGQNVSINNVNNFNNNNLYNANNNLVPDNQEIQYDGFTDVLTAYANLVCGEEYTIQLIIADAVDCAYSSAVFLEAGSFDVIDNSVDASVDLTNNEDEICIGDTYNVNGSVANTINHIWSTSGDGVFDNPNLLNTIYTPGNNDILNETFNLTLTAIDDCGEVTDNVIVSINPLPNIDAGIDQTICAGGEVTLIAIGGENYSWDNNINNDEAFNPPIGNTTYTVIGIDNNNCENSDQVSVMVNPLPNIDAGIDQTICEGELVTLTATGGGNYSWDSSINNAEAFNPPLGNTTYTVIGTDNNNCENSDQVTVMVNPSSTSTTDVSYCGSYDWNGTTYNTSGNYIYTTQNTLGCDSVATLNLSILENITTINLIDTVCGEYSWDGVLYTSSGIYTNYYLDALGCDSIVNLELTVYEDSSVTYITACDSAEWNGIWYYTDTVVTTTGLTTSNNFGGITSTNTGNEGNIWYFGNYAGLDFNSGNPVALIDGQLNTSEGCASIADQNGDLLFYTDGMTVYNKNHTIMPNGSGLNGNLSSTQSAIIVKKPNTLNFYYIFTVDGITGSGGGLSYSEVDMSLNGGLGDVTAIKNIELIPYTCEKVTAIQHQNGIDFWIVAPEDGTNIIHSFLFNSTGVDPVSIQTTANSPVNGVGYLKGSPDGSRIALVNAWYLNVEVYDFDNTNGILTHNFSIDSYSSDPYGVEFSPNSNLLYVSTWPGAYVYQYDLQAGTTVDIINSEIFLGSGGSGAGGALQLAPNNKIYQAIGNISTLPVINNPDVYGIGCNFSTNGANLSSRTSNYGLPTFFSSIFIQDPMGCDSVATAIISINSIEGEIITTDISCTGASDGSIMTNLYSDYPIENYSWSGPSNYSSNEENLSFIPAGEYNLVCTDNLGCVLDTSITLITNNILPQIDAGLNQEICFGESIVINGSGGVNFIWDNGITDGVEFTPNIGITTYSVIGEDPNSGCTNNDQVTVIVNPLPNIDAGMDQTICYGEQITLTANGSGNYSWDNGVFDNDPFNPNTTNIYTVTTQDPITNCTSNDQVTVIVNPLPNINAGIDQSVCEGEQVTLTATGGVSYNWDNGVNNDEAFNPSFGNTTYTVIGEDPNSGCINNDQVTIIVNPLPNIDAGIDQIICEGEQVILTANGSGNYSWDNGVIDNDPFNPNTTNTYTVTAQDPITNCTSNDQVTVIVNPLPNINAGIDQNICEGEQVTLIANGGVSYNWDNGVNNDEVFNPSLGNTTYTVIGTDSNNCANSDQVTVIVNPLPSIDAGIDQNICEGEQVILTANGSGNYIWDNGVIDNDPFYPNTTNTYTVTTQDPITNCASNDQVTVIVNPLPNINAGIDQTICEGEILILSALGGINYIWDNGIINSEEFTPPNGTSIYSVTGEDPTTGCTNNDQITVIVNSLPNPQITTLEPICLNNIPVSILASPTGGLLSGNGVENNYMFNPSLAGAGTHQITYSYTDFNNCSNSNTIDVVVNPIPNPNAGENEMVCGLSYSLNAIIGNNSSSNWEMVENVDFSNYENPNTLVVVPNYGVWNFILKEENEFGCMTTDQVSIEFIEGPTVYAGNDIHICNNEEIVLSNSFEENTSSIFWNTDGDGSFLNSNTINTVYSLGNNDLFSDTITLVISGLNQACPLVTDSLIIISKPQPSSSLTGGGDVCDDGSISTIYVSFTGTPPFSYTIGNGIFNTQQMTNNFTDSLTTTDDGFFLVSSLEDKYCEGINNDVVQIIKRPIPVAEFSAYPFETDIENPYIQLINQSYLLDNFMWSFGDGSSDSLTKNPIHKYDSAGTFRVHLEVETDYGCKDSISRNVTIYPVFYFYVPNSFTPDNDGLNDSFTGKGIGIQSFRMEIYTRWGELIFESDQIEKPWTGTYFDTNNNVPIGIYKYRINIVDEINKLHEYTGEVHLTR